MSYGSKYKMSFYDLYGKLNEVYFRERDYSGSEEAVTSIGGTPAILEINAPSDDPYEGVIRGTTAQFFLKDSTGFKYLDMLISDGKKYHVQWDVDSALFWAGFVASGTNQHPYSVAPYGVCIAATDALATLNVKNFALTGKQSLMAILAHCLDNIHLDSLPVSILYENINKYEQNHNSGNADSPLIQTYLDCDNIFYPEGKAMNCYDVINKAFFLWGVILRQSGGAWHILQMNISSSEYRRRKYTLASGGYTYSTNELHDPVIQTNNSSTKTAMNRLIVGGTIIWLDGLKEFSFIKDYGLKETFVDNPRFERWIDRFTPEDWTKVGGIQVVHNLNKAQIIREIAPNREEYITQTWALERSALQKIKLNIKYVVGYINEGTLVVSFALIITNAGVDYYYNFNLEQWIPLVSYFLKNYTGPTVEEIEIITDLISCGAVLDGELKLRFYAPYNDQVSGTFMLDEFLMSILKHDHIELTTKEYDEEIEKQVEINPNHNVIKQYDNLIITDEPEEIANDALIFENLMYYLDGSNYRPTSSWDYKNGTNPQTLTQKLISEIVIFRRRPRMIVASNLISRNFHPATILQDQYNKNEYDNSRKFMVHQGTYDAKYGTWDIELIEIYDPVVEERAYLVGEDGQAVVDQDGNIIFGF